MPNKKKAKEVERKVKFSAAGFMRCRVCGCTEIEPCEPACSWADGDLCSCCCEAVDAMFVWFHNAHRPRLAALIREYKHEVYDTPIPFVPTKGKEVAHA